MPRQKKRSRSQARKPLPTAQNAPSRYPRRTTGWRRTISLVAPAAASLLLIFGGFGVLQANTGQSDYMLGTADRIRIRVFEWRPARDEVHEWSALNSEYAIGANGRVSMPLIGEVAASGITTADLAKAIGLRLKTRMGLADAPDIAVEVTQYRPFYLSGYVEKPGEYPYRPGLNVGQALALGGGLLRTGEFGSQRLDRELIQTSGDLVLVSQEFNLLLARRARLMAEIDGLRSVTFPPALERLSETQPALAAILEQEREVFRTRRETFNSQTETLGQLLSFLDAELKGISAQIESHHRQTRLVQDELKDVTSLLTKGISTKPRKTALERNVGQMESEGIRLETSLMRVRQDRSRALISINELHNKKLTETTIELRDTQTRLQALAQRSDTLERLMSDTYATGSALQSVSDGETTRPRPTYRILRVRNGMSMDFAATEATHVEPGDSIKIDPPPRQRLNLPALIAGAPSGRSNLIPATNSTPTSLPLAARQRDDGTRSDKADR